MRILKCTSPERFAALNQSAWRHSPHPTCERASRLRRQEVLLSVLAQPTQEMVILRALQREQEHFPSRRTWERRLKAMPATLPAQIGCLGRHLIDLIQPWATPDRAVVIDSTTLQARGGVWHHKHREQGLVPHTSIDTEAHWTKSGWHVWVSARAQYADRIARKRSN